MTAVFPSLASVVLVSLVSLVGLLTISMNRARVRRITAPFVSFAVGTLLGDAFIHLIPETFLGTGTGSLSASLLILSGMMVFFVVEKLLIHRHGVLHAHSHAQDGATRRPALAAINVIGDAIHNFIDGVLIAASYLVSLALGLSTTVAVLFHEIPQEMGDFGILIHSGLGVRRAIWLNLASASASILGAAVTLSVGAIAEETVTRTVVPMAAGGFVYIAAADLIPELQHDRSLRSLVTQTALIALGMAVMWLLRFVG